MVATYIDVPYHCLIRPGGSTYPTYVDVTMSTYTTSGSSASPGDWVLSASAYSGLMVYALDASGSAVLTATPQTYNGPPNGTRRYIFQDNPAQLEIFAIRLVPDGFGAVNTTITISKSDRAYTTNPSGNQYAWSVGDAYPTVVMPSYAGAPVSELSDYFQVRIPNNVPPGAFWQGTTINFRLKAVAVSVDAYFAIGALRETTPGAFVTTLSSPYHRSDSSEFTWSQAAPRFSGSNSVETGFLRSAPYYLFARYYPFDPNQASQGQFEFQSLIMTRNSTPTKCVINQLQIGNVCRMDEL